MLGPDALCTFSDFQEYLVGQDAIPAAHQVLVEDLITRTSRQVRTRCNRIFPQGIYQNELHSGTGRQVLMTNQAPLQSIAQVAMLTAAPPSVFGMIVDPAEYQLYADEGIVWRERGWWAGLLETPGLVVSEPHPFAMRLNISVTYTAGWALPRDFGLVATATTGGSLVAGTTYYYVLTGLVSQTNLTSPSLALPLIIPTTLYAEPIMNVEVAITIPTGMSAVRFTWTPFYGIPTYRMYRGLYPGGEGTLYDGITTTSFIDTGATGVAQTPPPALPDDLRGAVLELVAGAYRLRVKQGIAMEIYEGMNIRYDKGQAECWAVVDAYHHVHTAYGI